MPDTADADVLSLHNLAEGLPALTPALGSTLAEAASVCPASQDHTEFCLLMLRYGEESSFYSLQRMEVTTQMRLAYNDLQEATELGACGVALLIALAKTGYTLVERSVKGTGFDYWLGLVSLKNEDTEPIERKARLEVSGILRGEAGAIELRLQEKLRQTRQSAGEYPAYAIVVEFSGPLARMEME